MNERDLRKPIIPKGGSMDAEAFFRVLEDQEEEYLRTRGFYRKTGDEATFQLNTGEMDNRPKFISTFRTRKDE